MGAGPHHPSDSSPHIPVLAQELCQLAHVRPGDTIVDGTFGAGGHASLLIPDLQGNGTYIGVDRDASVRPLFDRCMAACATGITTRLIQAPFPDAFVDIRAEGVSAQVVILDVGVSSMQLDQPERGFAYSYDAPLDMRMDQSAGLTAADLLNTLPQAEIERILRTYGEERFARRIAKAIVSVREREPFEHTSQLADVVRSAVPAAARERGGHPAKRTFQAIRIAVNDELGMLDRGLDAAFELLSEGGRLLVISFHSLEDRLVKQRFESWTGKCTCPPGLPICRCGAVAVASVHSRRAMMPTDAELAANARAASARLRVATKLSEVDA